MPEVAFGGLLAEPLRNGVSYPSRTRGEGTRMVNMRELFAHDRLTASVVCERVPLSEAEQRSSILRSGDLLFARQSLTYEGAGKVSIVLDDSGPTWDSHLIRARLDENRASPAFYYYFFRSPNGRRLMETIVQQVAAAGIRGSELARLTVPVPALPLQRAIAEVLGALDDKIAANTALAATAVQLASNEFMSIARTTEFGPTFEEVAGISGGGTPSTKTAEFWDGDVCWATPTDITALPGPYLESSARSITEAGLSACSSKLFEPGAILMTSRATIGALAVNTIPTAVNQGFIVVEPHDPGMRWWLFHEMESRVDEFISWANGATFLELSRGNFKRLRVRVPQEGALAKFSKTVEALHDVARASLAENRSLAATRDALLPQLMSGKLRVRDAEGIVSETLASDDVQTDHWKGDDHGQED